MMPINKEPAIIVIIPAIIFTLLSLSIYAGTIYGPAPTPVIYRTYTISMNLTDSRPTTAFLTSIASTYPLLYREDALVVNTTPVWFATANQEFTIYITNATPVSTNQPIILEATSTANNTGGITWQLEVPLYLVFPQQVYAQWYVVITENLGGNSYVVFTFRTGLEGLTDLLNNLTEIGGYLVAANGEPYYLWNYYYGYNPTTGAVSTYYEVGLPGINIFYTWVGQGINATPWPSQGFPEVLRVLEYGFYEYVNSSLISEVELAPNETVGGLTGYGYTVYQRPRLLPFGPIVYVSPILLLPNGTIANPMCIPGTYYVLTVYYVAQGGPRIPIYETRNYPLGLYLLNGSLLFGGYLRAYDFYNETTIPITPIQYLAPTYQPEVTEYTRCTLTILTDPSMKTGDSPVNNAAINVMGNYTADMGNALINHVGWAPHGFAQYRALTALRRTWPTLVLR
jgi:hypothetical protein